MCRWIAYQGQPIFMGALVTQPKHSLVEQSLNTKLNFTKNGNLWSINGDGFGIGWYNQKKEPGLFKDERPAWNDQNLHEICSQVKSRLFFAHVRASTSGAVQRSNAHPFKYKKWLFQHNGHVDQFEKIKRDLQMAIDPKLYHLIEGTTDSETLFYLCLTFGLEKNPKQAVQKMIQYVIDTCSKNDIPKCDANLSCAITDGDTLYTIRLATSGHAKTQFYSTEIDCLIDLDFGDETLPEGSIVVVSEPLDTLSQKWKMIPENSFVILRHGQAQFEELTVNN